MGALLAYDHSYLASAGAEAGLVAVFVGLSGHYAYDPTTHELSSHIFVDARNAAQVQPIMHVSSPAPPALLMHGAEDTTVSVRNTRLMGAEISRAGSHARIVEFDQAGHVSLIVALSKIYRFKLPVLEQIVEFAETFRSPPQAA